ncbi:hypothetical protein ONZ45_g7934 [Pleurotus djamor]|nr:hypothetical protein ONZ45_g7934 [Pleurotus djamor]
MSNVSTPDTPNVENVLPPALSLPAFVLSDPTNPISITINEISSNNGTQIHPELSKYLIGILACAYPYMCKLRDMKRAVELEEFWREEFCELRRQHTLLQEKYDAVVRMLESLSPALPSICQFHQE